MVEKLQRIIRDSATARWTVLIMVSLTMMCGYFLTDVIGPLKTILENTLSWDSLDFGIFNSGYGWLNVNLLMLIVGGIVLDKKGPRFTGVAAVAIMLVGATIKYWALTRMDSSVISIGGIKEQVLVSAIGYAIFAFGYETMGITATKIIVKWFKGKELAFALGMNVAFARLGTMLAMGAPIRIYEWFGSVGMPILFGIILLLLGFLAFLVFAVMDRKLDAQLQLKNTGLAADEKFQLRDILYIIRMKGFWYISILCLMFYISVMTFQKFGVEFISLKFSIDQTSAGDLLMLLPVGALFLTPLFGGLYDTKGRGATIMIIGSLMLVAVYILFAIPQINHWGAAVAIVTLLGISFSLVPSAMWPSVAKIIPEQRLGTAYALIFWVQNIGLAYAPLLIGWVLERYCRTGNPEIPYDYTYPMLIFMSLGVIAFIFGLLLKRENRIKGYNLEKPNIEKAA